MGERIGIREFARREKCDDKVVRRGIQAGRLPLGEDGKLDADHVGTSWRAANVSRPAQAADTTDKNAADVSAPAASAVGRPRRGHVPVRNVETPEQAILKKMGVPLQGISLARKAHIAAQRDQLDYDKAVGKVVEIGEVAAVVGRQLAAVRTRLLAIPAEHAPRLAMLKTAAEMQDALHQLVVEALTELVQDVRA